jgi:hypothetical protein
LAKLICASPRLRQSLMALGFGYGLNAIPFNEGTIGFLLAQWLLGTVIACTTCRKPEPKN